MGHRITQIAGKYLLPFLISIYSATLKIVITNRPDDYSRRIFIFWHGNMFIGWRLFKNLKCSALVSQSKDGEILNNLLRKWKYTVIRGSSSKGGKDAIDELITLVKNGISAVITPDGPRGPVKELKNGIFKIALEANAPIIPVKIVFDKAITLEKSWDKFKIPKLFSECRVEFGDEIKYNEYMKDDRLEAFKKNISELL